MEAANFAVGQILSWIRRHWLDRRGASCIELPADMLHEILLRLAADEVCRKRLVCRTWRSPTLDPHFARAHAARHPQPHVVVVGRHAYDDEVAVVRDLDLHGNVIKSVRIRRPVGPLSVHGDLLVASHGWGLTCVVDMVTGAVVDAAADPRKKVSSATPHCVIGHVPATGEYKVLRIQTDGRCRQWRQVCEVMTLGVGGGDGARRWRRRTCPPVTLCRLGSAWNVAVVAGLVYFVHCWSKEDGQHLPADSLAVFDLTTEEWKPLTVQGPQTSRILDSAYVGEDDDPVWPLGEEEDDDDDLEWPPFILEPHDRILGLRRNHFQLAKLGESLVVLYCNVKKSLTELWFMEDMVDATTARWSKRYTLQGTPFGHDDTVTLQQYHYPLAVLDDGRIVVWVERKSALKAYDPETCIWTDLATLTGDCVVGVHRGSLLCSNARVVQP